MSLATPKTTADEFSSSTAVEIISSDCFLLQGLLDNVTVLIGIAHEGKAIAGVINQPFYNYQVTQSGRVCKAKPPIIRSLCLSLAQGRI